ncbi:MAG: glycosyltransferase family 1 protein, partial [Actinomycetota bacterium]|nr:glycosyltransferase family 1 protein [Actinomycetota bacterium]
RGCRQVVHHEHTGLLVPVRDAAALAAAVARLVAQPAERARFGAAAYEKARKEFDQRRVIDITLATYGEQLTRRGLRAPRR